MNRGQRKKLLIVEDDPEQLSIRALLFEQKGYECLRAADARSALALAVQDRVQCIILDLNLPTESEGLNVIRRIQSLERPPKIVILTGRVPNVVKQRPELREVAAIVEKGGPTAELFNVVEVACMR